jgi:hypothetical protein
MVFVNHSRDTAQVSGPVCRLASFRAPLLGEVMAAEVYILHPDALFANVHQAGFPGTPGHPPFSQAKSASPHMLQGAFAQGPLAAPAMLRRPAKAQLQKGDLQKVDIKTYLNESLGSEYFEEASALEAIIAGATAEAADPGKFGIDTEFETKGGTGPKVHRRRDTTEKVIRSLVSVDRGSDSVPPWDEEGDEKAGDEMAGDEMAGDEKAGDAAETGDAAVLTAPTPAPQIADSVPSTPSSSSSSSSSTWPRRFEICYCRRRSYDIHRREKVTISRSDLISRK